MAHYPNELRYTKDHEWARLEGDIVVVGVTAFAVGELGDIAHVELPEAGTEVEAEAAFGDIESVKTASELFAPVSGEITEINEELADQPELVNDSPYGEGWLVKIKVSDTSEVEKLMDARAYEEFLGTV